MKKEFGFCKKVLAQSTMIRSKGVSGTLPNERKKKLKMLLSSQNKQRTLNKRSSEKK